MNKKKQEKKTTSKDLQDIMEAIQKGFDKIWSESGKQESFLARLVKR